MQKGVLFDEASSGKEGPSMPLSEISRGLQCAIETALETQADRSAAAGAIH